MRMRNQQFFELKCNQPRLCETLLLFIVDRLNLLCVLYDEWKLRRDALWRPQKKDRKLIAEQLRALLKQFVLLLQRIAFDNLKICRPNSFEHFVAIPARPKQYPCMTASAMQPFCKTQSEPVLLSAYTPKVGIYAK